MLFRSPPGNREAWAEFTCAGGEQRIALETIVGYIINAKSRRRAELGETVAAISMEGTTDWQLLAPTSTKVVYDDAGWTAYAAQEEARLAQIDTVHRQQARATEKDYWESRRAAAADWLKRTPEVAIPALPSGFSAHNAIDHFIAHKIATYRQASPATDGELDFYRQIWPILESRCLECHQGRSEEHTSELQSH